MLLLTFSKKVRKIPWGLRKYKTVETVGCEVNEAVSFCLKRLNCIALIIYGDRKEKQYENT